LVQRGGDLAGPQPALPLIAVPNVTAHPSTASVPITVFNGPLLCRTVSALTIAEATRWPRSKITVLIAIKTLILLLGHLVASAIVKANF